MTRLLHLLPIIAIMASATAALRASEPKAFKREFFKACGSLAAGFAGLAVVVYVVSTLV
jgi:hypothetical protein